MVARVVWFGEMTEKDTETLFELRKKYGYEGILKTMVDLIETDASDTPIETNAETYSAFKAFAHEVKYFIGAMQKRFGPSFRQL
jgi:hypothetical protein